MPPVRIKEHSPRGGQSTVLPAPLLQWWSPENRAADAPRSTLTADSEAAL